APYLPHHGFSSGLARPLQLLHQPHHRHHREDDEDQELQGVDREEAHYHEEDDREAENRHRQERAKGEEAQEGSDHRMLRSWCPEPLRPEWGRKFPARADQARADHIRMWSALAWSALAALTFTVWADWMGEPSP